MKKKIRAIQYGVGPIGASIARLMREKNAIEICGAIDNDPAKVGRGPKHRVNDLPGGHARLSTEALGVHGVWVNGRSPDSLPGTLLRDFA